LIDLFIDLSLTPTLAVFPLYQTSMVDILIVFR